VNNPLIIRVDAGFEVGIGHLMRCLALAHEWKTRGGRVIFVTATRSYPLQGRLRNEGFQEVRLEASHPDPRDWETTSKALAAYPRAWVVLDGYNFDSSYQRTIKQLDHALLVIDDTAHLPQYYADVILNQNIDSERLSYSCDQGTTLLRGVKYSLLQPGFLKWQNWKRRIPQVAKRVLVTFGGSDQENATLKAIAALQQIRMPEIESRIVAGPTNPNLNAVREKLKSMGRRFRLLTDVQDMSEWMAWADVAVSASGSTCWEMAFMGLPAAVLVLAENQQEIAAGLGKYGAIINTGWHASVSESDIVRTLSMLIHNAAKRRDMSERGRRLVDGYGASRVTGVLMERKR
jgi:UDP-2,4-diacetamido-2,4,6-trideoxy-beta-L-altropyranose hydrolase